MLVLVLRAGALDGLVVARDPFDAGGDVGVALTGDHGVGRLADRLEARRAVARHGGAVRAQRQPLREQRDDAAHVEALQPLRQPHAAVDLLDQLGVDLGIALEQGIHDEGAHLVGRSWASEPLKARPIGRSDGVDDHCFGHGW